MKGIERQEIARGVTLYHIPADRFKTVGITVNLYRPLSSAEATKNALLPRVLKCGCEGYDAPHQAKPCAGEPLWRDPIGGSQQKG